MHQIGRTGGWVTISGHGNRAWLRVCSGQLWQVRIRARKQHTRVRSAWVPRFHHGKRCRNWKCRLASTSNNKHSYGERECDIWAGEEGESLKTDSAMKDKHQTAFEGRKPFIPSLWLFFPLWLLIWCLFDLRLLTTFRLSIFFSCIFLLLVHTNVPEKQHYDSSGKLLQNGET